MTIHDNTQAYLNSFYAGEEAKIDTTAFKQKFNSELDSYISKNNLKVAMMGAENISSIRLLTFMRRRSEYRFLPHFLFISLH